MEEGQRSLLATSLAHFINDGLTGIIPLMYPVYITVYGISPTTVLILAGLQNVFSVVISPLIGKKSDTSGKFAQLITIGLIIFAVGAAGYATSGLVVQGLALVVFLLPFTVLIAVGSSFYHPLGATVLREKWKSKGLGRAMGINGSAGSVGRVVLPFSATLVLASFALPSLSVFAGLSLLGGLAIFFMLRRVRFSRYVSAESGRRGFWHSLLPDWILFRRFLPLTVISFSRGFFTVGITPAIPLYLLLVDHFSEFQAGIAYSIMFGAGIISQLLFGYLQDRLGKRIALGISNLGAVIALLAFVLSQSPLAVEVSLIPFGLFGYSAFPLLLGLVAELTAPGEMTSASSIVWGMGNTTGQAIAPLLMSLLALPALFGSLTAGMFAAVFVGIFSVVLVPFTRSRGKIR